MAGTARRTAVGMETAARASDSIFRGSFAIDDQSMRVVSLVVNARHSALGSPGAVSFFAVSRLSHFICDQTSPSNSVTSLASPAAASSSPDTNLPGLLHVLMISSAQPNSRARSAS